MKVHELIRLLSFEPDYDAEVMLLDGFNGGGTPRTINMHAHMRIGASEAKDSVDCEGLEGKDVLVLGFGCY